MQTEIIKANSLISIQLSPTFYTRLQEQLIWMITSQDPEIVKGANEKILGGQELTEPWEYHYYTLLSLINDIEEAARAQNHTEMIDLPNTGA